MHPHSRTRTLLVIALGIATWATTVGGQYSITVNKERLVNAQNEPQNWLLMNGDYGSQRYSKLTVINRDNVGQLRMVWALALGGMQDTGQNGPEAETNPLVDNGFMYTSDGWGTVYKIDARQANRADFVWVADPGVDHEGNVSRTRGIALWEDLVLANLPDGRVIAIDRDNGEIIWDVEVAGRNEFGNRERFLTAPLVADGVVIVQNGAGDSGTRGWVAGLDVRSGEELWRWYTVPEPGQPGNETWKDDHNAWKTGGGGVWQTGSYDPETNLYIFGTGNPFPIYDPEFRPGDNLFTNSVVAVDVATGERAWHFHYTPWGYPFNRSKLDVWSSRALESTIRGLWVSSRRGSGPMRIASTIWTGSGGLRASPVRAAATASAGRSATGASCARAAAAGPRSRRAPSLSARARR